LFCGNNFTSTFQVTKKINVDSHLFVSLTTRFKKK
jgi:hypothetical protein